MIVILGLTVVVAAAIIGVAGFVGNGGSPHALIHGFSVLNGDCHPAPGGRGSRLHLFGHRSAAQQDPATTPAIAERPARARGSRR